MDFLWFLLIGAVSGWLAGQLWKGSGFGLLGNIIAGIVGGVVGGWIAGKLGIGGGGLLWQIIIAAGGAWVILFLISLVKKK
ncbi:GlsB/YeaQ/YmgE family stress response membrane protein [Pedobacter punctiformis]|uniref:GlsB/YeaQ/YmgE family stress response membrane protein n=1 Tax=Pedobacter punctiformis TaxID=3004097 RepID=A0ABT4L7B5_9SPHI|nr:GlsB/YeaQ/YmgE family stress response membrane protein [Pedobacter sp. HCMS5-2]MCZ4243033.1 GlsB/YeaQ/YmgE family stress response membrane protein [Pedobacter sp. HCMS5-2]